jgi:hypothetical protein
MVERDDFSPQIPEITYRSLYVGFVVKKIANRKECMLSFSPALLIAIPPWPNGADLKWLQAVSFRHEIQV